MEAKRWLTLSVAGIFVCSTIAFSIYRGMRSVEVERLMNPKYVIDTIVQTGPVKEALPTVLLSELLDLSYDQPTNFFAFDEKKAEKKLLNSPVISYAKVKKIKPNKVYVDYELRHPIATFGDFENMAIDSERRVFPLAPYFSPMNLPEIVTGDHRFSEIITGEKVELAFKVLYALFKADLGQHAEIKKVDVSRAFSPSYGKKEIVVVIDHKKERHYLRLAQKNLESALANYVSLVHGMEADEVERVIDLRIEKLAYVEDLKG